MNLIATFKVPVQLNLSHDQIQEARAALNTFHLGDAEANRLNPETMAYEAKYPEKETEEFKTASINILGTHTRYITVGIDSRGQFSIIWDLLNIFTSMSDQESLIRFVEELRANPDDYKNYENTYENGWVDACNHVLNWLAQAQ